MGRHPYGNVSLVAAHNTRQARELAGHDSLSITIDAAVGALEQSGLDFRDIDAVFGSLAPELVYELGLGPASISRAAGSIAAVVEAANAVAAGTSKCALIAEGARFLGPSGYVADTIAAPFPCFPQAAAAFAVPPCIGRRVPRAMKHRLLLYLHQRNKPTLSLCPRI